MLDASKWQPHKEPKMHPNLTAAIAEARTAELVARAARVRPSDPV